MFPSFSYMFMHFPHVPPFQARPPRSGAAGSPGPEEGPSENLLLLNLAKKVKEKGPHWDILREWKVGIG